jgi:hypothetical protein
MDTDVLEQSLLGLLVDGPCSFAALYGGLIRHGGYSPGLNVDAVLRALREMEALELVVAWQMSEDQNYREPTEQDREKARLAYTAWLPFAITDDLSVDEVGLWYEIQVRGRDRWKERSGHGPGVEGPRWTLDDSADLQTIAIQAESQAVAEEALRAWLSLHPRIKVIEPTKSIEALPLFVMRDGTVVLSGVRLVCEYQLEPLS